MKNKAPLVLMEQLVMVLVFALAAALCVQAFVLADKQSRQMEVQSRALQETQNVVETLKSCGGDYHETARLCQGVWDGTTLQIFYSQDWQPEQGESAVYTLTVAPEKSEYELLGRAEATLSDRDGTLLCTLSAAWQEVSSHA